MNTNTIFTGAASSALTVPSTGAVSPMPAVDGSNTATTIQNPGGSLVALNFGNSPQIPIRWDMPSLTLVPPGQTILLPSTHPAGAATYVAILGQQVGTATAVITRGSTSIQTTF